MKAGVNQNGGDDGDINFHGVGLEAFLKNTLLVKTFPVFLKIYVKFCSFKY